MIVKPHQLVRTLAELHERLGGVPLDRILADPAPGSATEADVIRLLNGPHKLCCELVDGTLVEKAMGTEEAVLASFIGHTFWTYLKGNDLGLVAGGDGAFRLMPGNVRYPDVSFVPWDCVPDAGGPEDALWAVTPALAVEVLSKANTAAEIDRKLAELFQTGCRLAWVIDPRVKTAKVYTSATRFKSVDESGTLDGGKVLPGFKLPLADLFAVGRRRKKKPR